MDKIPFISRISEHLRRTFKSAFQGANYSTTQNVIFIYMDPQIDLVADPLFDYVIAQVFKKRDLVQIVGNIKILNTVDDGCDRYTVWKIKLPDGSE